MTKNTWKVVDSDSFSDSHEAANGIDENPKTYWKSKPNGKKHFISIDLGKEVTINGFAYTPQSENSEGMIESGNIEISADGKSWKIAEQFKFGNLINDPTRRKHYFNKPKQTRYIRLVATGIAGDSKSAAMAEIDFFAR